MKRRPPRATRTYSLFPYTTRFRRARLGGGQQTAGLGRRILLAGGGGQHHYGPVLALGLGQQVVGGGLAGRPEACRRQIGRAHVCTPVTNAQLVCRLLLEKNTSYPTCSYHITFYIQPTSIQP